jgi:hypothetical protein
MGSASTPQSLPSRWQRASHFTICVNTLHRHEVTSQQLLELANSIAQRPNYGRKTSTVECAAENELLSARDILIRTATEGDEILLARLLRSTTCSVSNSAYLRNIATNDLVGKIEYFLRRGFASTNRNVESATQLCMDQLLDRLKRHAEKCASAEDRIATLQQYRSDFLRQFPDNAAEYVFVRFGRFLGDGEDAVISRIACYNSFAGTWPQKLLNDEQRCLLKASQSLNNPRSVYLKLRKLAERGSNAFLHELLRTLLLRYKETICATQTDQTFDDLNRNWSFMIPNQGARTALARYITQQEARDLYKVLRDDAGKWGAFVGTDPGVWAKEIDTAVNQLVPAIHDRTCLNNAVQCVLRHRAEVTAAVSQLVPDSEFAAALDNIETFTNANSREWEEAITVHENIAAAIGKTSRIHEMTAELNRHCRERETLPVKDWKSPELPVNLKAAAEFWIEASKSPLFQVAFAETTGAAPAQRGASAKDDVERWVQQLDSAKQTWAKLLTQATTAPCRNISHRFDFLVNFTDGVPAHGRMDQAQSRQRTRESQMRFNDFCGTVLRAEFAVARKLLPSALLASVTSEEAWVNDIREVIFAIRAIPTLRLAVDCCEALQVPLDAASSTEVKFVKLAALDTTTGAELANVYRQIVAIAQNPLTAAKGFFAAFASALQNGRLVRVCHQFPSAQLLSQAIGRRLQACEERDQETLSAFEVAHRALSSTQGAQAQASFACLCNGKFPSAQQLFVYAEEVSWCVDSLSSVAPQLERVYELLGDEVQESATTLAMELILPTTIFYVTMNRAASGATATVALTATTEKRSAKKPYTSSELDDVFFQLTLAGSNADNANTDILNRFVLHYATVKEVVRVCVELAESGHPRFQTNVIRCHGSRSEEELKEEVLHPCEEELQQWKEFTRNAERRFPLLNLLRPRDLVDCLSAFDDPTQANTCNLDRLVDTLQLGVFALTPKHVIQRIAAAELYDTHLSNAKLSTKLEILHKILSSIARKTHDYVAKARPHMTDKFREVSQTCGVDDNLSNDNPSDVVILQLPPSQTVLSASVGIAIFASKFGRVPLSFEFLVCDATTANVAGFVRRWGASIHKTDIDTPFMFCITGAERLHPKDQAALLDAIQERRRTRGIDDDGQATLTARPKLVLVLADQSHDSIITTQLRDCVIAVPPTFVAEAAAVVQAIVKEISFFTTSSEKPFSGKTQAALVHAQRMGWRFGSATFEGHASSFISALRVLEEDREDNENIVLHVSVSHSADGVRVNDQLLEFAILGRITDGQGKTALRRAKDHVIIELPSQQALHATFRSLTPVLTWFEPVLVPLQISTNIANILPNAERFAATLHRVAFDAQCKAQMESGVRMLLAFDQAQAQQRMPYYDDVSRLLIPPPVQITQLLLKYSPAETRHDFGGLVRFTKFLCAMLAGVFTYPTYHAASKEMEKMDDEDHAPWHLRWRNFRKLAFFLVKFSINAAEHLALSAVPAAATEDTDESSRLALLPIGFENVREQFAMFTNDTYEFVSMDANENLVLSFNSKWNPKGPTFDAQFDAFATYVAGNGSRSVARALHSLFHDGDVVPYDQFKYVLPALGLRSNSCLLLLNALQDFDALLRRNGLQHNHDMAVAGHQCEVIHDGSLQLQTVCPAWAEKVARGATLADFKMYGNSWLRSLTASSKSETAPFVLTPDSLVRLLSIKTRLQCGIPVVLQGETGCGKTHLLQFFSKVAGTIFEVINIHRGVTASEIVDRMATVVQRLKRQQAANGGYKPIAIVLLDEVNSMESVWLAKSLVCDRLIMGRAVPDNVHFVCIMNPWRLRPAQPSAGLDYADATPLFAGRHHAEKDVDGAQPRLQLAYDVHRSPESFMSVVWDFGMPHRSMQSASDIRNHIWRDRCDVPIGWTFISDEEIFAESCISWQINKLHGNELFDDIFLALRTAGDNNGTRHFKHLRTLCVILVKEAQRFMREDAGRGDSEVSLRDIARTIELFPFMLEVQVVYAGTHPQAANADPYEPLRMLQRALASAFVQNYVLRLPESQREQLDLRLVSVWGAYRNQIDPAVHRDFLATPQQLYEIFDSVAERVCECLVLDDGIAANRALKENTLSLFSSIMHPAGNLAQFIVGRPGSTKSASLDALVASTDRASTEERGQFFRYWCPIKKFVIQCTRETTADAILRVARSAAAQQRISDQKNELRRCVIVLEEVGIAVGSKHNPLMVLHSLIDRGVPMDDGTFQKLPIVGISNWSLDAAKMNRMRTTFRGNPSKDDLILTAQCLMRRHVGGTTQAGFAKLTRNAGATSDKWVERFAAAFRDTILADHALPAMRWFYGMRDFYSFVSMVKHHQLHRLTDEVRARNTNQRAFFGHLVDWALELNFGGHPDVAVQERAISDLRRSMFEDHEPPASHAIWAVREDDDEAAAASGSNSKGPFCDMCARVQFYADGNRQGEDKHAPVQSFPYVPYDKSGVPCSGTACVGSARNILSYALKRTSNATSRLYRVRNVLVFTHGNAGVDLLYQLNIVKREEAVVIDPRDPSQLTPQQVMDDLARVRRCLRTANTLILVRAAHLYEPMFDVLNQHFSVETRGETVHFYSTLTMEGFTSVVPVSPDHRIIIVEDLSVASQLTAPFLNRCVKVQLGFESALSPVQRRLFERLRDHCSVTSAGRLVCIPQLLVPGFSDDTFASLALQADLPEQPRNNDYIDAIDEACEWIDRVVCPRRLFQLNIGLHEDIGEEALARIRTHWVPRRKLGAGVVDLLRADVDDVSFDAADAPLGDPAPIQVSKHLLVLTEQREMQFSQLEAQVRLIYPDTLLDPPEPQNVNHLPDDTIDSLVMKGDDEEDTCVVLVVDLAALSSEAGCAKLDSVLHRTTARCPARRHVVVIAVLPNSSRHFAESNEDVQISWRLTCRKDWTVVNVDEVTVPTQPPVDPRLLYADEEDDDESQEEDGELRRLKHALIQSYQTIATTRARHIAQFLGIGSDVCDIESAVRFCVHPNSQCFDRVCVHIVEGFLSVPDISTLWKNQASIQVTTSGSLRDQLETFITDLVQCGLQEWLPTLLQDHTYEHSDNEDTHEVFFALLQSSLVPKIDFAACLRGEKKSAPAAAWRPRLEAHGMFPFSNEVEARLSFHGTSDVLRTNYFSIFGELPLNPTHAFRYASDVMFRFFKDAPRHECDATAGMLFLSLGQVPTIIGFHEFIGFHHVGWLSAARGWVRGCTTDFRDDVLESVLELLDTDATPEAWHETRNRLLFGVSPNGILTPECLSAVEAMLEDDNVLWQLRLHRAMNLIRRRESDINIEEVIACQTPVDVLELLHRDTLLASVCRPLIQEILQTNESIHIRRRLLDFVAEPDCHLPATVQAFLVRSAIEQWMALDGSDLGAFLPDSLFKAVHAAPCGLFTTLVSRCFFDFLTANMGKLERIVNKVRNTMIHIDDVIPADRETFLRVGLTGLHCGCAWIVSEALLGRNIKRSHLTRASQQLADVPKEQVEHLAMFLLRLLSNRGTNLPCLTGALTADNRTAEPLIPACLQQTEAVRFAFTVAPPKSVLYVLEGFEAAHRALQARRDALEQANDNAVFAAAFIRALTEDDINLTVLQGAATTENRKLFIGRGKQVFGRTVDNDSSDLVAFLATVDTTCPWLSAALRSQATPPLITRGIIPNESHEATIGHLSARVFECVMALLHCIVHQRPRVVDADVNAAEVHIRERILTLRCPRCDAAFEAFDGCFSVNCGCGQSFCGWCFQSFPDAHAHVLGCPHNPNRGTYHGNAAQFRASNNQRHVRQIREYLNARPDAVRSATVGALQQQLTELGIAVQDIGIEPRLTVDLCVRTLHTHLDRLSHDLFGQGASRDTVKWWWCSETLQHAAELIDFDAAKQVYAQAVQGLRAPQIVEAVEQKKRRAFSTCETPWLAALQQSAEYVTQQESVDVETQHDSLWVHFCFRRATNAATFWDVVCTNEQFKPLRILHEAATSRSPYFTLEYAERYSRILNFIGDLQARCTALQITRKQAREVSLADFVGEDPRFANERVSVFLQDVETVWLNVERVFDVCATRDALKKAGVSPPNDTFDAKEMKLACFLPSRNVNDPCGGLVQALMLGVAGEATQWKGLLAATALCLPELNSHAVDASSRIFRVTSADILVYDEKTLIDDLLPLYMDPSADGGFSPDLAQIVDELLSMPGLSGKPRLVCPTQPYAGLPEYVYADEAASAIAAFNRRQPFANPSDDIVQTIKQLIHDDNEFATAAGTLLHLVVRELVSRPRIPPMLESIMSTMATPLLPEQRLARDGLLARCGVTLKTEHIVPVLAILWDGHVDAAAQVEPEFLLLDRVDKEVTALLQAERASVIERFIQASRIAALLFLQPGQPRVGRFFDGAVLDLVLQVEDNESFMGFESLGAQFTMPYFAVVLRKIESDLAASKIDAELQACRTGFTVRQPFVHNQPDNEIVDEEDALLAPGKLALPMSARLSARIASGRPSARLLSARSSDRHRDPMAMEAADPWEHNPYLDYGE